MLSRSCLSDMSGCAYSFLPRAFARGRGTAKRWRGLAKVRRILANDTGATLSGKYSFMRGGRES
jgi:hypothetical protein